MLRPTTLLRAFAAPSRRILLPQAAALAPAQQQAEQPPPPPHPPPNTPSASPAELSPAEPSSETTQQPAPKQRLRPKIRTPLPGLPYHVSRTPYAELPVYELAKRGGNKKLTNVKKVEGDKAIFRAQLAEGLALAADDITLNTLTGHIVVPGFRRKEVVKWLEAKGF
ncbi:mitochondrial large subunit ribosomal protein-domain-containing protein [Staphylotrichum tortipilum]|uniref:Large ribosomal subunit protein mL49 n=1 Tax=Staphylotrichum tortipilum TaxID=2831512 RepID=A0AAN6RW67_9PEZI|nr:mitochondrial large subunit ribosomal protein-domain-containing protein [Staphylotrichum longicolle]